MSRRGYAAPEHAAEHLVSLILQIPFSLSSRIHPGFIASRSNARRRISVLLAVGVGERGDGTLSSSVLKRGMVEREQEGSNGRYTVLTHDFL
jgi:hypothetical protein